MSQTPREILLGRHREDESKLDAIRVDVVSTIARADGEAIDREAGATGRSIGGVARLLWDQLFRPCRQVWGGLAGVWLAILILNAASYEESDMSRADAEISIEESMDGMRARRQLLAELSGGAEPLEKKEKPAAIRPRGEARRETFNV
jgi:hypothetical protein